MRQAQHCRGKYRVKGNQGKCRKEGDQSFLRAKNQMRRHRASGQKNAWPGPAEKKANAPNQSRARFCIERMALRLKYRNSIVRRDSFLAPPLCTAMKSARELKSIDRLAKAQRETKTN